LSLQFLFYKNTKGFLIKPLYDENCINSFVLNIGHKEGPIRNWRFLKKPHCLDVALVLISLWAQIENPRYRVAFTNNSTTNFLYGLVYKCRIFCIMDKAKLSQKSKLYKLPKAETHTLLMLVIQLPNCVISLTSNQSQKIQQKLER